MIKNYKTNFKNTISASKIVVFFILFSSGFNNLKSQCAGGTYSFTTAGATFSAGPTQAQINAAYLATNLNGSVVVTGGIQSFTVPTTGNYQIIAAGAGGGNANAFGGRGRIVQANINLTAGQVLRILVGQKGQLTTSSGGGGGSYVVDAAGNNTIIVGGGGAGFVGALGAAIATSDGNILTAGFNSNSGGVGGINGNGGNGSTGWGGGGGGFNTNGTDAAACVNTRGFAFLNGGLGGNTCNNTVGGFGGGGGTHGNTGGGGGGGGFSGGGGSDQNLANAVGGGGGSFFNATMTGTTNVGLNLNAGFVTITQPSLAPCAGVPVPGAAVASQTTGCSTYTSNLSLSGNVQACNLTYQWYVAPALGGPYVAIPGFTVANAVANVSLSTQFYKCVLVCGANSATSTAVNCLVTACVGTPTPGIAAANPSVGCATYTTALTLSGNVVTCGLTYQWQSGPAPGGPWTNIIGATSVSASVSNTVNTYYQCVLTCAGTTLASVAALANNVPCSCAGGTYTFTTAGATFSAGPTQAQVNAAYLATNLNGLVTVNGGIQSFTVPVSGNYQIEAAGAGGGNANAFGGRGRIVRGDITLTAGQVLRILVGQKGQLTTSSGGGGGSYVAQTVGNTTILVGGGGGGFVGNIFAAEPLSDANITTNGNNSNSGGVGGINGNGGNGSGGWGGGGGGFNTNGTDAAACVNTRGIAFLNGGLGGNTCNNTVGGFGGGGGTHGNTGGGGGGGGFSGGGGSDQNLGNAVGGGGGSFFNATMSNTVNVGLNLDAGYVTIKQPFLPMCAGTPTPGTAVASPSTACATYTTNLSLLGGVATCSQTYQWYAAPAPGGPYTAIPGATLMTASLNNTVTTYYQCVLACGGSTAVSTTATAAIVPCAAGTPTAGTAVANPTTACLSGTITLSLTGNVASCGLNYQWQVAPALAGPYVNIGGAVTQTITLTTTVTSYYRCQVSCGANTVFSNPATVSITPGPCPLCVGQWYIRSNSGEPWGFTNNPVSMTAVFGGTWTADFFQTVNVVAMLQPTTSFIYLEGGDGNALAMNTFVTTNIIAIQNWVNAGGKLFMNAAPNQGGNMAWGFGGVTLVYPNFSTPGNAAVGQAGHPIFNGPFLPAGTAYTGTWWSHAIVTGGGITDIITGTGGSTLAELVWGAGRVMFGGMSSWGWHAPTPNSQNLIQNIFRYLNCVPIILPVELTSYDLNYDGEVCNLKWKTSSEKNTDYFVIEKSLDGINYSYLDKLAAAGNSNQTIEYSTSDREPNKNGITYYRLKQYDRGSTDSKLNLVKTLNLKEIKKDYLKVQPNPANASMDVFLPEAFVSANKTINVFDLSGSKVISIQLGNTSSQTAYRLNIETLKTGMYSLQVVNEDGTSVKTTFIKN